MATPSEFITINPTSAWLDLTLLRHATQPAPLSLNQELKQHADFETSLERAILISNMFGARALRQRKAH
jgi:hypothetical protein